MNVRSKLLISQAAIVAVILAVVLLSAVAAHRLKHQHGRVELAYEQRQGFTMLAAQAFHYKTTIDDYGREGDRHSRELDAIRAEVEATLQRLATLTDREVTFLDPDEQAEELEEADRIGRLDAALKGIDGLVTQMGALSPAEWQIQAPALQQAVNDVFGRQIAPTLAEAVVDERDEVAQSDADMDRLARQWTFLLGFAGLCALGTSVAAGWFLYRGISRPVHRLLRGVRALQEGDLHHRVESERVDEFGQLATQFNAMTEMLEDREQRLIAAQADLERQVAQRTAELEAVNGRLKFLDRQRLLFLADISHELRTPVTVLRGEAEVTLRGDAKSPGEYRGTLQRIVQQAVRMGRLIDDLLFLARSEADTVTFERQIVDLGPIVAEAVRDGNVLGQGRGIAVAAALPDIRIWVDADAQRLRQAVLIAIDNAVKYSRAKSAIEVSLVGDGRRARITVGDRGDGIPAEDLPYVFDRFYRRETADGRGTGGHGLGLSIAKWITEKHGGTVALASVPGVGTTVTIELPQRTGA